MNAFWVTGVLLVIACSPSPPPRVDGPTAVIPPAERVEPDPGPAVAVGPRVPRFERGCEDEEVSAASLEEAKKAFIVGTQAYDKGEYLVAAEQFTRSYGISCKIPVLYNAGKSFERAGRREDAIEAYELYLEREPDSPHADEVRTRLDGLRSEP